MTEQVSVKLDSDLSEWLTNHKNSRLKSQSKVLREIIGFWEQCQKEEK